MMGLCSCHQADTDSSFRRSCQREENDFQGAANLCTLHDQDRPHPAQGVLWLHLLHHVGQPSSSAQDMTMVGCMSWEAGLGKRGFLAVLERPSAGARCVSINAWDTHSSWCCRRGARGTARLQPCMLEQRWVLGAGLGGKQQRPWLGEAGVGWSREERGQAHCEQHHPGTKTSGAGTYRRELLVKGTTAVHTWYSWSYTTDDFVFV